MRWGADMEERAACTKKAHDAYALGRQAMSKAEGAEAQAAQAFAEAAELRAVVAALRRRLEALESVPVVTKARKAA
jgi:hypothetical protein